MATPPIIHLHVRCVMIVIRAILRVDPLCLILMLSQPLGIRLSKLFELTELLSQHITLISGQEDSPRDRSYSTRVQREVV
jgi:hypothetical protein